MATIRHFPLRHMAGISLAAGVLPKLLHLYEDNGQAVKVFFALYLGQFSLFLFYVILVYPFFLSPLRKLPGVKGGLPLIGHGRELNQFGAGFLAKKWIAENPNDGMLRILCLGNQEMIIVNSPQALSEILVTKCYSFEKPDFARRFLSFIVGWGLLNVEGDEHKKQRRDMLPAFSFRHIKDLYRIFWAKSCEAVHELMAKCDERGVAEIEICSWAARCTLDVIGLAGIGVDFGSIRDANSPLAKSYEYLQPSPMDMSLLILTALLPDVVIKNLPVNRLRNLRRATEHIRAVYRDLIRKKRDLLANKEDAGLDILTVALRSKLCTEESLVDQMMTFLSAGHETTASSLIWATYLMAKHPDIQERLRREIRQNLASANCSTGITSADIDKLPYLNAVCSEVLRFHSPIPQSARVSTCDITVQGQFIPRNTLLALVPWATNTDPKFWGPDANEFKPERWLSPEQGGTSTSKAASGGATSNYAFLTFFHGPHSCIGASFAKAELACTVAAWIGRFSFELKDKSLLDERNIRIPPSAVAKPHGGMQMLVRVVEGW
ncbi:Cytochrome P450 [Metarhizium album ARSEF 1941]|uniref:Cytochrome P450 n=1 Tax=Metarhizium album (strain ARSEF 1941) TaxID=1081103 RepID=A0A0B2X6R1_METAS|nr:Cytochrome P450 [Metarhizium album ARSEF 1941]KHO01448.1 Cytochrome P450 [Metarhizium album ARSEF 1941]